MIAISATFSDFRIVKGRKVAQLIFETPLEAADEALRMLGGLPRPDAERWVGIAPLKAKPTAVPAPVATDAPPKERRPFHTLPRSQQAALLCNDHRFRKWWMQGSEVPADLMDANIKAHFRINSKRELDPPGPLSEAWDGLVARYRRDTGLEPEERA